MNKIPFYIVTGFLGGGKTTFLKHFLHTFSGTYRIGVIQNEFAPGQVDGAGAFPISRKNLEAFITEMLPLSYRIKGTVKLDTGEFVSIQAVMGQVKYRDTGRLMQPTELIAIGPGISPRTFGRRFHEYRKKES